ncbi:MAG: hypothetical protein DBY36_01940 [Clostridiales bacterium]|nr:MAG: hypothetical protein DBY36_01940 [Clostridiales bacterium]
MATDGERRERPSERLLLRAARHYRNRQDIHTIACIVSISYHTRDCVSIVNGEFLLENFTVRLKALRSKSGITQKQLGEATGLSARGIQDYELEQRKPGLDALLALADYFDVSLDYLVGRSDEPERR